MMTINDEALRIANIMEKLRNAKRIVLEDYLETFNEKMIDIHSQPGPEDSSDKEKLS